MFQFAIELKEAYAQGKTTQLAKVLLPLFNNSHQNWNVNESRTQKQIQVSVNKSAKLFCGCHRPVCGKGTGCVKVECVDV